MISFTRRKLLAAAGLAPAFASPVFLRSAAASTRVITVASLLGEEKPETRIWRWIAERAEERLPRHFRFRIVANGALGGEKEVADGALLGSIQASLCTVSTLTAWVPELQILDLPFLYSDAAHLRRVVRSDVGSDLVRRLASHGFVASGFIDYGARHLLAKEPITLPEQMQGKTMRVIQSRLHTSLWSRFGAIPVGIPITETYNALSTGVADAMDLTISAYAGLKLHEVVPYLTRTAHIRSAGVIFYAANFWDRLEEEEQRVLAEISAEASEVFNGWMAADEEASLDLAVSQGTQVLQPERPEDWRKTAEAVWQEFSGVVGGREVIDSVLKLA
nr:ABC transporter substrate-binding protein [Rhizobium sp. TCK]